MDAKISGLALIFLALLASAPVAPAVEKFNFTTKDGKEIENATYSRRTPEGVAFMTDHGVSKVRFEMLPKDLQERFGYDPEQAAAYRERKAAEAEAKRAAAREVELARRAERERKKFLPEKTITLHATVLQVLKDGVLVHRARATEPGQAVESRQVQTDGPTTLSPKRPRSFRTVSEVVTKDFPIDIGDGTAFLASPELAATALDGQQLTLLVYPIGRFQYTDKHGADRTVARFTTDDEIAIAYGESELAKSRAAKR